MSLDMQKYSTGKSIFGWYMPVHTESYQWDRWKKFIDENTIDEDLNTLYEIFTLREKKFQRKKKNLNCESKFVWITIQDFKRRISDLDKLKLFISNIKYLYSECTWCIESGKVPPPDSNLHIHMLCKIINPKKHKNKLNMEWIKLFDTNLYTKDYYLLKQWRESPQMPPYNQWVNEKLDYFVQESKGTHENSIDLNCRGNWSVEPG